MGDQRWCARHLGAEPDGDASRWRTRGSRGRGAPARGRSESAAMRRGRVVELFPAPEPDDMTDERMIAAIGDGDRAACGLLFTRYAEDVHRFVARMRGSDRDAIQDIVQSVFLAAFRAALRYRGGSVRAWLFGIAANHVREHARREIRRKHLLSV